MNKLKKRMSVVVVFLVMAIFIMAGCASFTGNAYKTLTTSATVYESTMAAAGDAYKQGLITDEDKAKIISIADKYWTAYHASVIALEVYERTKSTANKSKAEAALVEVSRVYGELLSIIRPLIKKGETSWNS